MTSAKESALLVRSIIADYLRYKLTSTEPLDRAIDFLSLGRDLVEREVSRWPLFASRKHKLC
jgi:hypothetical protein